jgi:hypothetical protein
MLLMFPAEFGEFPEPAEAGIDRFAIDSEH